MSDFGFDDGLPLDVAASQVPDARANVGRFPVLATRLFEFLPGHPIKLQMLAGAVAAGSLTQVPDDALSAVVQVQDNPVRYTLDGTTPTAAVGHRAAVGDVLTITGHPTLKGFQFVNEGVGVANLAVTYFN